MSGIRTTVLLCAVFITIVVSMFVYSVVREPQLSDSELRERGVFLLPTPREVSFELTNHEGETFTQSDLEGRWTFAYFGFTHCPDICPTSMAVLGQAERLLHGGPGGQGTNAETANFLGMLVTVDPDRDTAEVLGRYVTAFSPRFVGLLGERAPLAEFATQVNVAFAKLPTDDGYTVDHTGNIVIFNPRGHYHGFIKLPHDAETVRLTYQSLASRF